ncbi:hypothetical protein [Prevotella sp.]|uniref:hypothetical protein n=2 Tax=Prevotella sp. TaxID=59823 RepID=UPI003AB99EDC
MAEPPMAAELRRAHADLLVALPAELCGRIGGSCSDGSGTVVARSHGKPGGEHKDGVI